ncbi:MAG: DUF3987 domain-containing protein [Candidatus Hydrogenedentes bacterium]|nr:DUF3987 domain-containing protein [Candidatus Hydrogenedentota bacterium]
MSASKILTPTEAALAFMKRGWSPTPIRRGQKTPVLPDWNKELLGHDDVARAFNAQSNIGLVLGEASGGLVDVDIDHPLAIRFASLLPPTDMRHGREGLPTSHYWYQIDGDIPKTSQFKDPVTGNMIIELRSTGGQTVVPPSRYQGNGNGVQLVWDQYGKPGMVTASELIEAVSQVAALTLLADRWNHLQSRHVAAMALAGMLLRGGFSQERTEEFIDAICDAANDDEEEDRVRCVAYTAEKIAAGEPATGTPALAEMMDEKVVAAVQKWLGLKRVSFPAPGSESETAAIWDTPLPFDTIVTPDIPASLLPGGYGDFASALSVATETPEPLALMCVLGILSTACSRRFSVQVQTGWIEPLNIYIMVALPPAHNKSSVTRAATHPIDAWESDARQAIQSGILQARSSRKNEEALIASMRGKASKCADATKRQQMFAEVARLESQLTEIPVSPQLYLNDVTPETLATAVCEQNGRIAIISDEGGIMEIMAGLYSKGHANYDILLKGIDGGRVRLKRKDRDIDVNPYITMLLVVQPQIIRNMAGQNAFQGRGLLERFLYILPRSNLGYRTLEQKPIPVPLQEQFERGIRLLLDMPPVIEHGHEFPRILTLSDGARKIWQDFRHEVEAALRPDGTLYPCLGWGGKIAGFTLRIAGLLQVAEHGGSILSIDSTNMGRAVTLARLLIDHALAAFGLMREDEAMEDAKAIDAWIVQTGEASFRRTDCLRKLHGRFTGKKRFDAALSVLIDRNIISPQRQETTTEGKRATTFHDVNPLIFDRK